VKRFMMVCAGSLALVAGVALGPAAAATAPSGLPAITSTPTATFYIGQPDSWTVTGTGDPAPTLSESGALPAGVTFDSSTGVLSGAVAVSSVGTYPIQFTATNSAGSATQAFTLTVSLPSVSPSNPVVLNYSDGTMALYTTRDDGRIWSEYQSVPGGAFSGWEPVTTTPGGLAAPTVIETKSGLIWFFVVTSSGTLMAATQSGPAAPLSGWSQVGSATDLVSAPDALLTASGVIAIYAADSGGAIEGVSQVAPDGAFANWQTLSPDLAFNGVSEPVAIQTKSGVIAIYANEGYESANPILAASQSVPGGPFGAWTEIGININLESRPVVLLTASGVIAIYATDAIGEVEGISQFAPYSTFGKWQILSPAGDYFSAPAVLQTSTGIIAIYASANAGSDNYAILGTSQSVPGGRFGAWGQIGSNRVANPPVALITNTRHVIALYTNYLDEIWGISQSVPYGPFGSWQDLG
jgi:Putative Ig domain